MKTLDKHLFHAMDNYPYSLVETIESLEYALSSNDKNTMALCLLGRIYAEQLLDYETAKEYFSEAISYNIHALEVYPFYVQTLIKNEDFDEANRLIDFSLTLKGIQKLEVLSLKVTLLEVQKEFKQAKKLLKEMRLLVTDSHYDNYLEDAQKRIKFKMNPKGKENDVKKGKKNKNAKKSPKE